MKSCVLVLDVDIEICRVVAMTPDFEKIAQKQEVWHPGSEEVFGGQAAQTLWEKVHALIKGMVEELDGWTILALSLTGMPGGTVVWNRETFAPLACIFDPRDQRVKELVTSMKEERREPMVHFRTGLYLDARWPGTQLAWLLNEAKGLRNGALDGQLAFGSALSWILWQLTGGSVHAMDAAAASQTLLFDLSTYQWESQLLATFDIPSKLMPRIGQSNDYYGETVSQLFGRPLPIVGLSNHASAQLYTLAEKEPDHFMVCYDHELHMQVPRGYAPSIVSNMMSSMAWVMDGHPFFKLSCQLAGFAEGVRWLARHMELPMTLSGLDQAAAQANAKSQVVLVPAFEGYGPPFFDPHAQAAILGLSADTSAEDLAKALLESQTFQCDQIVHLVERITKKQVKTIVADSRQQSCDGLMQMQADIAAKDVVYYPTLSLSCLGATALTLSKLSDQDVRDRLQTKLAQERRHFAPQMDEFMSQKRRHLWHEAFERARSWSLP